MSLEKGLFRGKDESDFSTDKEIKRRLISEGQFPEIHSKDYQKRQDVSYWTQRADRRSNDLNEATGVLDVLLEVELPPWAIIALMGDLHFGHPKTDYKRIEQEVLAIKETKRASVILGGDLVDGIFWGGNSQSEQSANLEEQYRFLNSLVTELKGRVIVAVSGEHDSKWASKTGIDPYILMTELANIPYVRGVAEVSINTGSQRYDLVTAHKLRGHSMYNNVHPEMRAGKELQGADIYSGHHTHTKGYSQQSIRSFGDSKVVTYISNGPYKNTDDYSDRSGFSKQRTSQLFGHLIQLNPDRKDVRVDGDIIEGLRRWG